MISSEPSLLSHQHHHISGSIITQVTCQCITLTCSNQTAFANKCFFFTFMYILHLHYIFYPPPTHTHFPQSNPSIPPKRITQPHLSLFVSPHRFPQLIDKGTVGVRGMNYLTFKLWIVNYGWLIPHRETQPFYSTLLFCNGCLI